MRITDYSFFNQLKELPFIQTIWLYGSRARGDHQERSDIDLAISCPTATREDWSSIQEILENADTLLKIDCIRYDQLNSNDKLKQNIDQFKKVLFTRE